jgi:hypothetical protein
VDGFIGQGSISQDNFLGKAWRLNLAGSFGGDSTTYQLGLLDPYFMDKNLALGFDLYRTDREWDEYSKEALGGKIKLGLPITYATRTFFIYKFEQKDIYDVDDLASYLIREQEGRSTLSSIYASLSTNTTDYRPDPSSGFMSGCPLNLPDWEGPKDLSKRFWITVILSRLSGGLSSRLMARWALFIKLVARRSLLMSGSILAASIPCVVLKIVKSGRVYRRWNTTPMETETMC